METFFYDSEVNYNLEQLRIHRKYLEDSRAEYLRDLKKVKFYVEEIRKMFWDEIDPQDDMLQTEYGKYLDECCICSTGEDCGCLSFAKFQDRYLDEMMSDLYDEYEVI